MVENERTKIARILNYLTERSEAFSSFSLYPAVAFDMQPCCKSSFPSSIISGQNEFLTDNSDKCKYSSLSCNCLVCARVFDMSIFSPPKNWFHFWHFRRVCLKRFCIRLCIREPGHENHPNKYMKCSSGINGIIMFFNQFIIFR